MLQETKPGQSMPTTKGKTMTHRIYAIRDAKAEYYSQPAIQKTHGEAERMFEDLANDTNSQVSRHPEDFDLYYLGTYDDVTGKISPLDSPQHICKAIDKKQV